MRKFQLPNWVFSPLRNANEKRLFIMQFCAERKTARLRARRHLCRALKPTSLWLYFCPAPPVMPDAQRDRLPENRKRLGDGIHPFLSLYVQEKIYVAVLEWNVLCAECAYAGRWSRGRECQAVARVFYRFSIASAITRAVFHDRTITYRKRRGQ